MRPDRPQPGETDGLTDRLWALTDFVGVWNLERQIHDHLRDTTGTLTGTAVFKPGESPTTLNYVETGQLKVGTQAPLNAERRYVWQSDGHGISAYFDDGGFFHQFVPQGARAAATHFCAPDDYRVNYDFSHTDQWTAQWHVKGPRKRYMMLSRYWR